MKPRSGRQTCPTWLQQLQPQTSSWLHCIGSQVPLLQYSRHPHGGLQVETHWPSTHSLLFGQQAPLHKNWLFPQQTSSPAMALPSFKQCGLSDGQHCLESAHQRLARQQVSAPPGASKQVSPFAQHLFSSGHWRAVGQQTLPMHAEPVAQQVVPLHSGPVGHSHMSVVVLHVWFAGQVVVHSSPQSLSCPQVLPLQVGLQQRFSPALHFHAGCPLGQQSPLQLARPTGHMHTPDWQVSSGSAGQAPPHTPPQPSGVPHGWPWQLVARGQHWLLPLQTSPDLQQSPLHSGRPLGHLHVPPWQVSSGSARHVPVWHVPPQSSLAPHAFPVQLGVQHALPKHF